MKANNYEQTLKQIPNEWGVKISDSIDELSKDFYHVVLVQRVNDPEREAYRTSAHVKQFRSEAWNNKKGGIKEQLPLLGYKHFFILHDPTKKVEEVVTKKPAGRPKKEQTED
jgi:hypothetical protein